MKPDDASWRSSSIVGNPAHPVSADTKIIVEIVFMKRFSTTCR